MQHAIIVKLENASKSYKKAQDITMISFILQSLCFIILLAFHYI